MAEPNQIAGYEILGPLGHGARSHIYEVADSEGAKYALKHVVREDARDERMMAQAVHEHEVAQAFEHPNLRRSYTLIRRRKLLRIGEIIVVMELVRGQTIEAMQLETVADHCTVYRQVCAALHGMHQAGWIHADIKPNNILVDPEMNVKVIDYGQSCPSGEVKPRVQGTPDYIAPEQVRREPITPRTDVFNLGATMYRMLTGRHIPTLMPNKREVVGKTVEIQALRPPMELNPDVPQSLSGLILECVRDDARERPTNMNYVYKRLGLCMKQLKKQADLSAS